MLAPGPRAAVARAHLPATASARRHRARRHPGDERRAHARRPHRPPRRRRDRQLIHEAAFRGSFSALATRDAMARAHGRRKLHVLEAALNAHEHGSAGTKSGNERTLKRLITRGRPPGSRSRTSASRASRWTCSGPRTHPRASRSTVIGHGRRPDAAARTSSSNACSRPSATPCCASARRRSGDAAIARLTQALTSPVTCSARPCRSARCRASTSRRSGRRRCRPGGSSCAAPSGPSSSGARPPAAGRAGRAW